jgi:hypothetical protein
MLCVAAKRGDAPDFEFAYGLCEVDLRPVGRKTTNRLLPSSRVS